MVTNTLAYYTRYARGMVRGALNKLIKESLFNETDKKLH